jgi:hypothetical protein
MKKRVITLFALATLSVTTFTVVSCSDDDNNNNTEITTPSTFVLNRDNLSGEINDGDVILESGVYKLTGKLIVKSGARLIIRPGVIIEATTVNAANTAIRYIAISQGGKIDVQGTATNPVIMTSTTKTPGAWGGLVLCGKAPINKGATASAEVSELTYGGTDAADNSGTIKYLRIEYPGYAYNSEKEFNGISFFGIGNGTVVENVQVFESSDDGFEWFGGTVNTRNLAVVNASTVTVGDDLFDWTEGWSGTNENWYGKRTNAGNRGVEADNNANNHLASPISNPIIKNLTLIGVGPADTSAESQAFKLRVGTKGKFDNVVLSGWKTGFDVQHTESIGYANGTDLKATRVKFENVTVKAKGTDTAGAAVNVDAIFTEDNTATGAGNGVNTPTWAQGWTTGMN